MGVSTSVTKQCKASDARLCHLPILPPNTPTTKGPAPYLQHLNPTPSCLCPHCLTKDWLRLWTPASCPPNPARATVTNDTE